MGDVFPCDLNEKEDQLLGNIKNSTLQEIWNGETLKNIRLAFLNGDTPPSCKECSDILYNYTNDLHKYVEVIKKRII